MKNVGKVAVYRELFFAVGETAVCLPRKALSKPLFCREFFCWMRVFFIALGKLFPCRVLEGGVSTKNTISRSVYTLLVGNWEYRMIKTFMYICIIIRSKELARDMYIKLDLYISFEVQFISWFLSVSCDKCHQSSGSDKLYAILSSCSDQPGRHLNLVQKVHV
jgi:hypothetical protein